MIELIQAPRRWPPFSVQAVALEEDTHLVLSAKTDLRDPRCHPIRLMTDLVDFEPRAPGSVEVHGRRPYRLLAVVHDLDTEPSCRSGWIQSALGAIFSHCERLGINSLGLEPLGHRHGHLPMDRFRELLAGEVCQRVLSHPRRIWLMMP